MRAHYVASLSPHNDALRFHASRARTSAVREITSNRAQTASRRVVRESAIVIETLCTRDGARAVAFVDELTIPLRVCLRRHVDRDGNRCYGRITRAEKAHSTDRSY